MISLFANDNESINAEPRTFTATSYDTKEERESPSIIRNASNGYGRSNRFYRQARQIYDRAVVLERLSQQQTA
jgi:hypothetical protein